LPSIAFYGPQPFLQSVDDGDLSSIPLVVPVPKINFYKIPTVEPNTTVVKTTNMRAVVTITCLFGDAFELILRTRPNAIAPLIMPAYQMKTSSPTVILKSALHMHLTSPTSPKVPQSLPIIIIQSSMAKNCGDHSYLA